MAVTKRNRAAYMREYRARKRRQAGMASLIELGRAAPYLGNVTNIELEDEVARLHEEIVRLKRELAARPGRNPYAEFRPAPKPGR